MNTTVLLTQEIHCQQKWKIGKPIYMHQTPAKQFNNVLIVTELFWFIAAMIKITLYYMKNFCNLIGLE